MIHLTLLVVLSHGGGSFSGEQFMRVLRGLHSDIHDVEFLCEGTVTRMSVPSESGAVGTTETWNRFQSRYAFREDGAEYLDLYARHPDPSNFLHRRIAQLRGALADTREYPDMKGVSSLRRRENASTGTCTFEGSPERFLKLWYWRQLDYSVARIEFTHEGWEEIGGTPTARINIDEFPKNHVPYKKWSRYWVDLEHGGHVVRHEHYWGSNLVFRVHNVVLAPVLDEQKRRLWFPTHAEFDSFADGVGKYRRTPVFHECYDVVNGSLVLNRVLPDSRFSLDWKPPRPDSDGLAKGRKDFKATPMKPPPQPLSNDPVSVQRRQMDKLAQADRQARQLDASPAGEGFITWVGALQWGLGVLGVAALCVALLARRTGFLT
ncbi:MAG: hypothetical protein ACP5XB_22345 [Isosphaeraceae bacterium]